MSSRSTLTCKLQSSSSPGSSKTAPLPPQTSCSMGMRFSQPLPRPSWSLFTQNYLMVLSNALFSHQPTFPSFLTDLPGVTIYENANFQYKRVQRLHVLLQAVTGHRESWLEIGTPSAGPQAGRTSTGGTCQRLRCHIVIPTQQPKCWQTKNPWEEQDSVHGWTEGKRTDWVQV